MKEVKYIIKDQLGIHARPAGLLVKTASKFNCSITIKKGTSSVVDAKGIIGVMTLGAKHGDEVTVTFDGADEVDASEAIRVFLEENL
jgi:phosphocarrier protein